MDSTSLDRIAEEFAIAVRNGDSPSIDEFVSRYPDAPSELQRLLRSVAMLEGLKETPCESPVIRQLDDYSIIREIGRGGMGIVFEAIHRSLGRRVAIKVLSSGLLGDSKHLGRFRREARAAAKLRHSNIVPVFGVGQADQHHYYVMDFIEGMSLRESIDSGRGFGYRKSSQIGVTICDALQYAHSQGVLHRDIKPANLLIDRKGEVWIADFGLAKLLEQNEITATGEVLGTPQYMPPESFDGTYDIRSEIYAVGLTLYELLTQKPAIEGKSPAEVIRNASSGVITRPRALRTDLPRDLETIVLKCLAHDPRQRYAAVGDVRDDLTRFLADRPIAARRAGMIERALRWSRRQPALASLTFATFGLLMALAIVSAIGYWRTKDALDVASAAKQTAEQSLVEKTAALNTAEHQRQRAENNLQVALAAFDSIMQNITKRGIDVDTEFFGEVTDTTSPNVTPADAKLLQSLLRFFDDLGANNSEDLLAESALASRRAGEIYQRLGQLRDADRAYSEALERYQTLSRRNPDHIELVVARAELQNEIAVISGLRGQLGRADQMYRRTIALSSESEAAMKATSGKFQLARAQRLFASIRARSGLDTFGSRALDRAGFRSRRPAAALRANRIDDELRAIDLAIETLQQLADEFPEQLRFRVELARAFRDRAKVASMANQRRESETAIRQSIEMFEKLLAQNSDSDAIRYELANTLSSTEAFGYNAMLRAIRAAELANELLKLSPDQPRYLALRAHTLAMLSKFQLRNDQAELAASSLDEAFKIYDSLAAKSPELSLYVARRLQVLESKSDLQQHQGDTRGRNRNLATIDRTIADRNHRARCLVGHSLAADADEAKAGAIDKRQIMILACAMMAALETNDASRIGAYCYRVYNAAAASRSCDLSQSKRDRSNHPAADRIRRPLSPVRSKLAPTRGKICDHHSGPARRCCQ